MVLPYNNEKIFPSLINAHLEHIFRPLHPKKFIHPYILYKMNFFRSCVEASQIVCGSFEDNAILTGVSDTIIVKQKDGSFKSTPLLVCFGPYLSTHKDSPVEIIINGTPIH